MTSLAVAGIVLPILIIIAYLPLGLDVFYAPGTFRLTGYVWFVPFRIGRKETREVDKGASWLVKSTKRYFIDRHGLQVLLKNGYTILCRLVSRVRVELLMLRFTAAGSDPARGALTYAAAGTALEGLSHVCEGRVAHAELRADVDFSQKRSVFSGRIRLSLPAWRAVGLSLRFGWGVLRDHHRLKKGSMNTHDQSAAWQYDGNGHGQDPLHGGNEHGDRCADHNA